MRLKSVSNVKMLVVATLFAFVASCMANEATHQSAMEPLQAAANLSSIEESTDTLGGEERIIPLSFIDHYEMQGVFVNLEDTDKFRQGLEAEGIHLKQKHFITHFGRKGIYLNSEHLREIENSKDSFGAIVTVFRKNADDFATANLIAGGGTSTETKDWAQRLKIGLLRQWVDEKKTPKDVMQLLKINKWKHPHHQLFKEPLFLLWIEFVMMSTRVQKYGPDVYEQYEIKVRLLNEAAQLQKKLDLLEKEWKPLQAENIRLTEEKNRLTTKSLFVELEKNSREKQFLQNEKDRLAKKSLQSERIRHMKKSLLEKFPLMQRFFQSKKNRLQEETDKEKKPLSELAIFEEDFSSEVASFDSQLASFKEKKELFNGLWDRIDKEETSYNTEKYRNNAEMKKLQDTDDEAFKAMSKVLVEEEFEVKPVTEHLASVRKEMYQAGDWESGYTSNGKVRKFD